MKKSYILIAKLFLIAAGLALVDGGWAQTGAQTTPPANPKPATTTTPQSRAATGAQQAPAPKKRAAGGAKSTSALTLKTPKDKVSYALGMSMGTGLHKQSIDVDSAILVRGLKDGLAAGKTLLTEQEMRTTLTELQGELRKKQQEAARVAGEANKKEGEAFLAANRANEGVVALPSGLQYKVLTEGTGPKPALTDSVVCNYRGTLINGTEFDSSYKRGQPITFPVNGVIKGWTEALQLMPVGSKWQLFIPSELAYGDRGGGPLIGPNATLIFEVELISIQVKAQK